MSTPGATARRGMALFLVIALALLLYVVVSAVFQQGQDAMAQAIRTEGRLLLLNALRCAADEGWFMVTKPGLAPAPPARPAKPPIDFYHSARGWPFLYGSATTLDLAITTTLVGSDPRIRLDRCEVRVRARKVVKGLRQGLIEITSSGEFRQDRTKVSLSLSQLRPFWLSGTRTVPRFAFGPIVVQAVEES